jgi:16S rRNA (guanine(527)-N(7))-methyltransferase RsmG
VFRELLRRCAVVSEDEAAQLESHFDLLSRWNKVLNLTRIEGLEQAVERHYCESLFLAERIPRIAGLRIADIGSGAGFPGFPVAVVRPESSVALIESHQRKAVFLREASRSVSNIHVVSERAESVTEAFDWIISRAVSYADLDRVIPKSGARVALLTGEETPPTDWQVKWDVVPLPSGRNRFLRVSLPAAQKN